MVMTIRKKWRGKRVEGERGFNMNMSHEERKTHRNTQSGI